MNGGRLRLRDVGKTYRTTGAPVVAVESADLEVEPGELHVIVGPSGCGKSTLLGAVAGFTDITRGTVELDGRVLCGPDGPSAAPGPDRVVVFQDSTLFPWRTVAQNLAYGPEVRRRRKRAEALADARERLARAGLAEVADRYPGELSSGAQRHVEILRALSGEPSLLLLDEPFRGMDAISRAAAHRALLETYDQAGTTVLFITHDVEEAVLLGDRVSVMTSRPGRIKTTIGVGLERPRRGDVVTADDFRAIVAEVTEAVRGEAERAFASGERERVR